MTYKAFTDDQKPYDIRIKSGTILLNNREITLDLAKINEHLYHIISQNQSVNVEVVKSNLSTKQFLFKINGKPIEVVLHDQLDQLIEQMGMQTSEEEHEKEIAAPMPGLILSIAVKEGQEVKKGDVLLTLEAMKMENALKSPTQGVVAAIRVKERQSVEKNQLLVLIE